MKAYFPLIAGAILMAAPVLGAADSVSIDDLAGVYKHTLTQTDAAQKEYKDEQILEIAKISDVTAYFRTYVGGPNYHMCSLWGVATLSGQSLEYVEQMEPNEVCRFSIELQGDNLIFHEAQGPDRGSCSYYYCGSRAELEGSKFALKSRREIRYMKTLRNSEQYREAVEKYDAARKLGRPAEAAGHP